MSTELPDWIREGAKIAVYQFRAWGPADVQLTTITRLTNTQVILDGDIRYRRDTLRPVGTSRYDAPELLPVDHPKVVEARDAGRLRSALRNVRSAAEKVRTDHDPVSALAALDALAQAVANARKLLGGTDADMDRAVRVAEEGTR